MTTTLFDQDDSHPTPASAIPPKTAARKPRLRVPQRDQVEMQFFALDQLLDPEHPARIVWAAVAALDRSRWLVNIQAVEHEPGRDATDPRLLVALWVYATTRGVGFGRALAKLCGAQGELPYRWLCGGVSLKTLSEDDPAELSRREKAARERASREREQRVQQALENCEELQKQREIAAKRAGQPAKDARASTTDPEARNMKFPDGGYAPGYNVQFSTDTASGVIVGMDVTNSGTDYEAFAPMLEQLRERYNQVPAEGLMDGGFVSKDAIENAAAQGCTVFKVAPCTRRRKAWKNKRPPARIPTKKNAAIAQRLPPGENAWARLRRN